MVAFCNWHFDWILTTFWLLFEEMIHPNLRHLWDKIEILIGRKSAILPILYWFLDFANENGNVHMAKRWSSKAKKRSIFPWDALKLSVWSMLLKMAPLVYCLLRKLIRKGSIRTRRKLTQNTAFFCLWNSTLRPFKLTQKKNESWEKILDIVLQENVISHSLSEANDPWNSHFHIFSLTSLFLSTLL